MSVSDILHKTIDDLSEEQRYELLEVATHLLRRQDDSAVDSLPAVESDEERLIRETAINQELLRRYQHLRDNPNQVVPARESSNRLREKYGWQ